MTRPKGRLAARAAACLVALAAGACGGGGGGEDAGAADADTDADADGGTAGAIEVTGTWGGAQPEGVTLKTAVFPCPWTMPPTYSDLDGTIDPGTGGVHGLVEGIEPGPWCVMAYVDMNPDDGLAPVEGTDAVNATGLENGSGAIPVEVAAGETEVMELTFAIR